MQQCVQRVNTIDCVCVHDMCAGKNERQNGKKKTTTVQRGY